MVGFLFLLFYWWIKIIKYFFCLFFYYSICFGGYCDIYTRNLPIFDASFDTIGDSITWWNHGEKLRCLLLDKGLKVNFVGNFIDIYGFNHDGHGGDTSKQVLDRLSSIPISDFYFLLIGTNDHIDPVFTANTIIKISEQLSIKNRDAKIYVSTLLPKTDKFSPINSKINKLLRNAKLCPQCQLVDLGAHIESLPNWKLLFDDGVHPNAKGYEVIVNYLIEVMAN